MVLLLALRNLRRATWRTALAGSALALAAALLVVALALIEGLFSQMVRGATRRGDGEAVVVRAGGGGARRVPFAASPSLRDALVRLPAVDGAAARLRLHGLLIAGERRAAAEVVGIEPDAERGVTDLLRCVVAGAPLARADGDGVLLGRTLAGRLGVGAGGEITLVTPATDALPAAVRLRVSGLVATGDPRRDAALALVGIERLRQLAGLRQEAHEIALALRDPAAGPAALEAVRAALPPDLGLTALGWQTRLPALAEALRFSRRSTWWLVALFQAAAGLVVLTVLLLGAHERRREHAVCLALGTPPGLLRGVVAAEALLLGAGAIGAGLALGALAALALDARGIDLGRFIGPVGYAGGTILPVLRASLRAGELVRAGATLLTVAGLAGWLAGGRIPRIDPARAIAGRDQP